MYRYPVLLPALLLSALLIGCSSSDKPPTGEVTGTIKNSGTPVVGALVEFVPENGRPSMGQTDQNGKYTLYYAYKEPGAKIGMHKVRMSSGQTAAEGDDDAAPRKPMPKPKAGKEFLTLAESVEVKSGANTFDFDLANIAE
jgi:hypothetical protein